MASTTETGHAKNIANLKALNETNAGFGATYNPSNPLLGNATMVTQHTTCNALQNAVNAQEGIFKPIVNKRHDMFKHVKPFARRVRSVAKTCGAKESWVKDVNTVITKLLGERASKAKPTATDPAGTSASQQSYDNTVNNVQKLIEVLKNEPLYTPNEVELQIVTIEAHYTELNKANNDVKVGVVPYNNAVIARNKALYAEKTGLVDVGQASKDYVRGIFGYSSLEFKLVSKLKFTKLAKVDVPS